MLSAAVSSYLALRRTAGFGLKHAGQRLESFAAYSDRQNRPFVHAATAIEWAGQSNSRRERSRRLGDVARMARFLHAEDERHEIPPAVFGSRSRARPTPFILATNRSPRSSAWLPSRATALCAGRPTAPCSRCWRVPGCGWVRRSGCDMPTSLPTG